MEVMGGSFLARLPLPMVPVCDWETLGEIAQCILTAKSEQKMFVVEKDPGTTKARKTVDQLMRGQRGQTFCDQRGDHLGIIEKSWCVRCDKKDFLLEGLCHRCWLRKADKERRRSIKQGLAPKTRLDSIDGSEAA
ncbi:MAG: hypothetical protein GY896_22790 [Gammaproteobacteria bacterium]|nr:hypothetical protein [Gammaproteobacteria bacterium]